jgi:hypothetical protein
MYSAVNLAEKLASFDEPFSPRIIEPKGTPNVGDADAEAAPEVEI